MNAALVLDAAGWDESSIHRKAGGLEKTETVL
jgi:hypothetical protein